MGKSQEKQIAELEKKLRIGTHEPTQEEYRHIDQALLTLEYMQGIDIDDLVPDMPVSDPVGYAFSWIPMLKKSKKPENQSIYRDLKKAKAKLEADKNKRQKMKDQKETKDTLVLITERGDTVEIQ